MNITTDRRDFIKKSTAAGIGLGLAAALPTWVRAQPASPSNRLRVAVIGTNSRGLEHLNCLGGMDNVEIAYVCDVEDGALAKGMKRAGEVSHDQPRALKDFRKALEDKTLDAVTIAAPDHWHTPMAILAMDAGKHVYVEKPCSHNPGEGELLLKAIARYNKLVQMGNQRRSFPHTQLAAKEIAQGIIGKAYYAKAWYDNTRGSIGHGKQVPVPPNLDYELWQGPAPRRPYQDNLIHYNWHWFWHWGTGEACNNGTHEIDCCRWFLGVNFPQKVVSAGGRYAFKDDWQTPDTQIASYEFAEGKAITWEGRSCNDYPVEGASRGFIIYGDGGSLVNLGLGDYKIFDNKHKLVKEVKTDVAVDPTNPVAGSGNLDLYHFSNFVKTVRGEATLNSPVDEADKSVLLCHLANIAQRTTGMLHCDPSNGHVLDNPAATTLWRREYEKGWEPVV